MLPRFTRMCCLLAGLACLLPNNPASAQQPAADTAAEIRAAQDEPTEVVDLENLQELEEVIIYGTSGELIAGVHAESELGEADLAAYGANTVGELLSQVAPDVDSSEQGPVILINGRPANGIRSVNDLPPEAVARMQVLPPQAAAAIGEDPTRRVINVVLKAAHRQGTANATTRAATAGRGLGGDASFSMLRLADGNISNISVNARFAEPLLESQRGITSQRLGIPYDLHGNVVAWPATGGEIDPGFSAIAGVPVTVAGAPAGVTNPTISDFLPLANIPNASDIGRYRSLVPDSYNLGVNGNISRQLPRNTALSVNANVDHSGSRSFSGATPVLLHVPAASPFNPFDGDVGMARYLGEALQQQRKSTNVRMSANLSKQLGKWRLMTDSGIGWGRSTTDSERRVDTGALQTGIDMYDVNPFAELPLDLLDGVLSDHARARTYNATTRAQLAGALFDMPAGRANATLSAMWQENGQRSATTGTINVTTRRKQTSKTALLSVQLPLLGAPQPQSFAMGAELNGSARAVSESGTMYNWGTGLNWRKGNRANMRVGFNREKLAPSPASLTDPVITVDDYRTYDFIREETVLVRYITGGNPDLRVEMRDIINITGQVRPIATTDFTLTGQYTRTMYHDPMSQLPAPSEAVQAAFPDRFRRDAEGRLVAIDARMVNFDRTRNEQLRIGGNFRRTFGAAGGAAGAASSGPTIASGQFIAAGQMVQMMDGGDALAGAGWRLNANFTHQWQLAYKRLMRPGTPVVDLISGGAGTGTGQPRHRVQSTIGLAHNGTGMQLNGNWNSSTFIIAGTANATNRIDFDSMLRFNLQAFTNLGTRYPDSKLMKGLRISLNVENLLDSSQKITDQNGETPLRYQRYLMEPLGRVVSLSFRKSLGT